MRYKISAVWTPGNTKLDRSRKVLCFDHDGGLRSAAVAGPEALGLGAESALALSEFSNIDSSSAFWSHPTDNGEYEITVEHWESDDLVTPERLRQWATERANEEGATPEEALVGVLGRQCWIHFEGYSEHDLRTELHEMYIDGRRIKGYTQMPLDELISIVMEEVVTAQRDNYCDVGPRATEETEPWGFAVMIKDKKRLWLGEGF